jgi:hypothetical protein
MKDPRVKNFPTWAALPGGRAVHAGALSTRRAVSSEDSVGARRALDPGQFSASTQVEAARISLSQWQSARPAMPSVLSLIPGRVPSQLDWHLNPSFLAREDPGMQAHGEPAAP